MAPSFLPSYWLTSLPWILARDWGFQALPSTSHRSKTQSKLIKVDKENSKLESHTPAIASLCDLPGFSSRHFAMLSLTNVLYRVGARLAFASVLGFSTRKPKTLSNVQFNRTGESVKTCFCRLSIGGLSSSLCCRN
jgi:hypothetical protein